MNIEYMNMAIEEAKLALLEGEVPVGCVIVRNGEVIAKAHNKKESMNKVTKHSEIIAIEKASEVLNNWRLTDCDIYITLEPCPMCASAIKQSRIQNIYCGLSNLDSNNRKIIEEILKTDNVNPGVNIRTDIAVDKIKSIMQDFFQKQRKK